MPYLEKYEELRRIGNDDAYEKPPIGIPPSESETAELIQWLDNYDRRLRERDVYLLHWRSRLSIRYAITKLVKYSSMTIGDCIERWEYACRRVLVYTIEKWFEAIECGTSSFCGLYNIEEYKDDIILVMKRLCELCDVSIYDYSQNFQDIYDRVIRDYLYNLSSQEEGSTI